MGKAHGNHYHLPVPSGRELEGRYNPWREHSLSGHKQVRVPHLEWGYRAGRDGLWCGTVVGHG